MACLRGGAGSAVEIDMRGAFMDIAPIFASLHKHRTPVALIVLEIALACAVFCNAVFIIGQRVAEIGMSNAIAESQLVVISVNGSNPDTARADIPRNLAALRGIPGVTGAAVMTSIPFGQSAGVDAVSTGPDSQVHPGASRYMLGEGGPRVLGLRLLKGRFFGPGEYADSTLRGGMMPNGHVVIITQSLAQRLWPSGHALGQQLWVGSEKHYAVIGVTADVARPGSSSIGRGSAHYAVIFPLAPDPAFTQYVVRSAPQNRQRVLHAAEAKLHTLAPNMVIKGQTFAQIRDQAFTATRSMAWVLVLVCLVMLTVTAFGIVGLSSFWVRQRRRQIGIRRAIGATRANILRYFQTENFLIVSLGIALGMVLSWGVNLYLMKHYELPRLPWHYLPVGALTLWLIGQLAALGPALHASRVPPVVATRSV
jgi:putative ABC transport system permease protein